MLVFDDVSDVSCSYTNSATCCLNSRLDVVSELPVGRMSRRVGTRWVIMLGMNSICRPT